MPSPFSALATLRPDLAASFMQFNLAQDRAGFVASQVCPVMDVDTASGSFGVIPVAQLLQTRDTKRAPGSGYSRGKWTFTPDTYTTAESGAEEPVDDNEARMYRRYFDAEQVSAQRAYDAVLRNQEVAVAALMTGASITSTATCSVSWKTYATSDPITDIETAMQLVYANSGIWPNTLIITRIDFRNLRESATIINRIKYSGLTDPTAKGITTQVLSQVFDIENVVVAGSTSNSANEGQAAAFAGIWPVGTAVVCHVNSSNDIRRPTVARTFHWGEDGSTIGGTVESYRDETIRGDVVRVRFQVGNKLLYAALATKITGCNA
jgi:hypothetical protein